MKPGRVRVVFSKDRQILLEKDHVFSVRERGREREKKLRHVVSQMRTVCYLDIYHKYLDLLHFYYFVTITRSEQVLCEIFN